MSASLFTAPLTSIYANDVRAFLDLDQEEGLRLDYKAYDSRNRMGLPDTMYRAVCAFANTYGGLIVIGVDADGATNRPTKRDGIPLKKGLEEAITSKCQSLIFPPVAPEVAVTPFKSDDSLAEDDRAFVVVRVIASMATPHMMQGDNAILVRVGSECRNPDLYTLRALLDREKQQEGRTQSMTARLNDGMMAVTASIREPDDSGSRRLPARYAPDFPRIALQWVPIDTPTKLISLWTEGDGVDSPDYEILKRLKSAGWDLNDAGQWNLVRLPAGIGVVAAYRYKRYMQVDEVEAAPVDVIYLDASGGMLAEISTASLGASKTIIPSYERDSVIERLVKRVDRSTLMLGQLLRDKGYAGRVQASVWINTGTGPDLYMYRHTGSAVFSVVDTRDATRRFLVAMLSQLTRSWLSSPFTVFSWEGNEPLIKEL